MNKRPRHDVDTVLDLKLLCAGGTSVLVTCDLLSDATRSPAIKDILAKLREAHPGASADAPMELDLSQDSATAWQLAWRVIEQPLTQLKDVLKWHDLEAIITLADKYELLPVLQASETFMVTTFMVKDAACKRTNPKNPFGSLVITTTSGTYEFPFQLSFLELLVRTQMHNAFANNSDRPPRQASSDITRFFVA